jgi:hypothetical protein
MTARSSARSPAPATAELPFALETDLERRIAADPVWREGMRWREREPGHPEATVAEHVAEVLANIEASGASGERRAVLRLVALVHDALKFQVVRWLPAVGPNHHARRAARFARRYVSDPELLEVVRLHDEAYHAWQLARRPGGRAPGEWRARWLLRHLGARRELYLAFYRADTETGAKTREPLRWFERLAGG